MRAFIFSSALVILSGWYIESKSQVFIGTTQVDTSTVVSGLDTPWEILWGPDDYIWFTERSGKISRVHPGTGERTELISIGDVYEAGESGLLGMVLHPDFVHHPYVFVVYTYLESSSIKERLVRYTYADGSLDSPLTLLEGIDGAGNHDGSRLVIDAGQKLFMTTGDAGDGSQAQDLSSLSGKVLRLNLDGSVPDDNPIAGSYLWSWGHRNPQGLVISPKGIMYSSEHGPSSDDEVNILEKGRNYGWPTVRGYCDLVTETQFCADSNVVEPIAAWTPTAAVAGTDFYHVGGIPEWHNSLLVTTLKEAELLALQLSEDGKTVVGEDFYFDNWWGRLRDLCISPDGRVFLAVSNRDGRGTVRPGDDRIVEIAAVHADGYCYGERNVFICSGSTYDFYGLEISEPGTYLDTIARMGGCDSILTVRLYVHDAVDIGLQDTVWMALNETRTLTAHEGFVSYTWNNGPPTQDPSVTLVASELGVGTHDYTVEVETARGCVQSHSIKIIVSSSTSVGKSEDLSFSVYPNPFGDEGLYIEYSISEEAVLCIYDQAGREIYRKMLLPSETRVRIQPPGEDGLYNLVLVNREGTRHLKVVKL